VDQKFIDLAAVLFDNIRIVKDPGYNVAWWNIHCRRITRNGKGWLCNNLPLGFFHFSSYQPHRPDSLTSQQNRVPLSDMPDLQALLVEYRQQLLSHGYDETINWPYDHDYFTSGEKIEPSVRQMYRENPDRAAAYGDPFESQALKAWMARDKRVNYFKEEFRKAVRRVVRLETRESLRRFWRSGSFKLAL
jgi:hypothetical protein